MYQNYIFDLYGTLIDIHTNEDKSFLWRKMADYYGYHGAHYLPLELKREYKRLCLLEEEKLGAVDFEIDIMKVFLQLFQFKGVTADVGLAVQGGEFFRILSMKYLKLYDGVIELLEDLKNRGKAIYVLSNAQRIFTAPEIKMLQIDHYFDGICLSSDYGYKKPSSRFFEALISEYQLNKYRSIMIGNDPIADIMGANKVGLSSLYIHSNLSPQGVETVPSKYAIMNGDVKQMKELI